MPWCPDSLATDRLARTVWPGHFCHGHFGQNFEHFFCSQSKQDELIISSLWLFSQHFCPGQFIPPADAMEVISTTKGGQKLCFEGHIYTQKNECIGKDQIICNMFVMSCNCSIIDCLTHKYC